MSGLGRGARVLLLGALGLVLGCRQDMHDQPRIDPLEASDFFADGQGARAPVAGTVARGQLREDSVLYRGIAADGSFAAQIPLAMSAELLARGRERYEIFCAPCHGAQGDGRGMIVRRGFAAPSSFHSDRLRATAPGYYFDVMTNGFGKMSGYASQISPQDRWAIVGYVRALQLSRHVAVDRLSSLDREQLAASEREAKP